MATQNILFTALIAIIAGKTGSTAPVFTITSHSDPGFASFNRKVEVFDIPIYAAPGVDENRLLHAANIMAQYLDNDEDGKIDNQPVVDAMKSAKAFMVMWKNESDLNNFTPPENALGQDLGNDETVPEWHTNGHTGRFDAALEEVLHIITHAGYAAVYPATLGEKAGTSLANAMDTARGGVFLNIPNQYPAGAWYTYYDQTCTYDCMVTEYFYWGITTVLGAQEKRLDDISAEWSLNTPALLQTRDTAVYALITDSQYKLPQKLPDGTYRK